MRAYAEALEVIPYTLAENAGLHAISVVTELRNRHAEGEKFAGINAKNGRITDMVEENVLQPLLVTSNALQVRSNLRPRVVDHCRSRMAKRFRNL